MRASLLKFIGFMLWFLFLFMPFFAAQANDGFDVYIPLELSAEHKDTAVNDSLLSIGGYELRLDSSAASVQVEDKWALKFNAGRDSVLSSDLSPQIQHDRLPLDNGERKALRFGIGLNYRF